MALKMTTPLQAIDSYTQSFLTNLDAEIIRVLSFLGEKCVIEARTGGTYLDHSGNLRGSTGYLVVANGRTVQGGGFGTVGKGTAGPLKGEALAKEIASRFSRGYALIVVAGMHYAVYVEAIHNKTVLSSAKQLLEREFPRMMKQLETKVYAK